MIVTLLGPAVLSWLAAVAGCYGTEPGEKSVKVVRVVVPKSCVCTSTTTPRPGAEAGCNCIQATVTVTAGPVDGVCERAGCEIPRGCVMSKREIKVRLVIEGDCPCEKATVSGTGADAGIPAQTITDVDVWSEAIPLGGHALECSSLFSPIDSGSIKIECTTGGTPVPRTLCSFGFGYACVACGS